MLLLVSCLVLSPVASASVSGPKQDEADFMLGMQEVRRLRERGEYSDAAKRLRSLVETYKERDFVVHRRMAIREEWTRCAVRAAVPYPDPASIVSAHAVQYDESIGRIQLEYTPETLGDFEPLGDLLVHPAFFVGDCTLTLEGDAYDAPILLLGHGDGYSLQIQFGEYPQVARAGGTYQSARILEISEGRSAQVLEESRDVEHAVLGRPYRITVEASDAGIETSFGETADITTNHSPGEGQIVVGKIDGFRKLTIAGRIDPAWIARLASDAIIEADREFLDGYDFVADVSEWLRPHFAPSPEAEPEYPPLPWKVRDRDALWRMTVVREHFGAGRYRDALDELQRADAARLPVDVADYYEMTAWTRLGVWHLALEPCRALTRRNPTHLETRMTHANLLENVELFDAAIRELERALELDSRLVSAYVRMARIHRRRGDLASARESVLRARRKSLRSAGLDEVDAAIELTDRGPNWPRSHELVTEHYRVVSDAGRPTCEDAARRIEAAYDRYQRTLGPIRNPHVDKAIVYIFASYEGYRAYVGRLSDAPHVHSSAGLYHDHVKQLLLRRADRASIWHATLRHEGAHQYSDLLGLQTPQWFEEGLAEYLSTLRTEAREDGIFDPGGIDHEAVEDLKGRKLVPLASFVDLHGRSFYEADIHSRYQQAWAFVHYLRHGPPEIRKVFDTLLTASATGIHKATVVERAFEDVDMEALEENLGKYIESLAGQ